MKYDTIIMYKIIFYYFIIDLHYRVVTKIDIIVILNIIDKL